MTQDSKTKYTDKQKRKAAHIEEGYRKRGVSKKQAEARAWRTVNKTDGGGKKPGGSGQGEHKVATAPSRKVTKVQWAVGAGKAIGKVLQVFRRKVTKTLKGKEVTRNATPEKPALRVKSGRGGEALKSVSELKHSPGSTRPHGRKR